MDHLDTDNLSPSVVVDHMRHHLDELDNNKLTISDAARIVLCIHTCSQMLMQLVVSQALADPAPTEPYTGPSMDWLN